MENVYGPDGRTVIVIVLYRVGVLPDVILTGGNRDQHRGRLSRRGIEVILYILNEFFDSLTQGTVGDIINKGSAGDRVQFIQVQFLVDRGHRFQFFPGEVNAHRTVKESEGQDVLLRVVECGKPASLFFSFLV